MEICCSKCKILKNITDFYEKNRSKCKDCIKLDKRENYKINRDEILKGINKEKRKEYDKEYNTKHKEKRKETYLKSKQKRKDIDKVQNKEYRKNHKERLQDIRKKRYQTDTEYKIMCCLRSRIQKALKGKNTRTIKLLGCTIDFYKKWLEFQFDCNMTWENHGIYWHIDHVIPCASFSLEKIDEQFKCFNWKNCRPLIKETNLQKSDKIIETEIKKHEQLVLHYIEN